MTDARRPGGDEAAALPDRRRGRAVLATVGADGYPHSAPPGRWRAGWRCGAG